MQATLFPVISDKALKLPLYLTSIGHSYKEVHVDRLTGYDHFQWLHTVQGSGQLKLGHKTYDLTPGHGVFLHPNVPHQYYQTSEPWITEWFTFNGRSANRIVKDLGFTQSSVYELKRPKEIASLILKGYDLANSNNEHRYLDLASYIFDTLVQIAKFTHPLHQSNQSSLYNRLFPVIDYLEASYNQPLDMANLAEMIGVSPQYLCTLFQNVTGNRPSLYLNQLRINKAKELMLIHPDKTIAQIAAMVGFESPSYFSSVFKRHEQHTPGEFIRLHRS